MSEIWNLFIINPMTNALLWLTGTLGGNFILALIIFTIITRVIMLPLNLRQQRSMMKTQEMQPQIKAIQTKYKDNPQKMQEEFAKIGYNPADTLTGCLPMVATMPILFGLFQVLRLVLGTTPQALFELTQRVYPWIDLTQLLPIDSTFLWLNLGQPDPLYILPVLVFATMFLQTKMTTPGKKKNDGNKKHKGKDETDPSAAMSQSMQYTMPIMFGFFSLSFASGLSIYFILSNLVGIGQGWYTRRVMAKEKEVQAQSKKLQKMGMSASSDEAAAMDGKEATAVSETKSETKVAAKDSDSAASDSNGSAQKPPKKKKKQSKRKRKSKR
ncbi:MAG TPA: YidC/Oxa1 family membrane protein insertase [Anaerolineae bacterium]|nr:YidC/Oxa1 family membrane protein insertase [Anaerolineae bacterium]